MESTSIQVFYNIFNVILDAGVTVILPIIITVVSLILGMRLGRAFRSGLILGIGFTDINLVANMMRDSIESAAQTMIENFGIHLDILDVGWGSITAAAWASPIIALLIPTILATSIAMLVLRTTDTLDVDIWNYHHMAIVGISVYYATKNTFLGVSASVVMMVISFELSDWIAPLVEGSSGIPGVSLSTMSALSSVVTATPLNWFLDKIPRASKLDFNVKGAKRYLDIFGEPVMLGLIFSCVIEALARYSVADILTLDANMTVAVMLIPKMTSLLMEGLMSVSKAAKKFCQEKFKGRKLLIDLDVVIVVGNPDVITTSLIVIPLVVLIAALLSGNRIFPFTDLAVVTFRVAPPIAMTKDNLFKSTIIGLFCTGAILLTGTATPPILIVPAGGVGLDLGSNMVISFVGPSLIVSYSIYTVLTKNLLITIPVMAVVTTAV